MNVGDLQMPPTREADDAPLWMPAGRQENFMSHADEGAMQSDGSGPVAVYFRLPPDLFFGARDNVPLNVSYRYNSISLANNSTMRVTANGTMVNQIGLPREVQPRQVVSHDFLVPLVSLRPFSNTLLFHFYFQIAKTGACTDTPPIDLQGVILRNSYLDLRGLHHWAQMPNLELFANAGFPFTRFADLSQTRVILPVKASAAEIQLYLVLMAYFGEQTGYPSLRVEVGDTRAMGEDKDYLVLGNAKDQQAFSQLEKEMPVAVRPDGLDVRDTSDFFSLIERSWWRISEVRPDWWWRLGEVRERSGLLASLSESPDALLQGLKSPWGVRRSVVTITLKNDDAVKGFMSAFWLRSLSADISQSVSVLHGKDFSSYRLGNQYYYVGHLPLWLLIRFWMHTYPTLIVVIAITIALLVVPLLRGSLRRHAQQRLGEEERAEGVNLD
jgi:cellulose synthase (UDP-forming)